jgi:hypothetical protein
MASLLPWTAYQRPFDEQSFRLRDAAWPHPLICKSGWVEVGIRFRNENLHRWCFYRHYLQLLTQLCNPKMSNKQISTKLGRLQGFNHGRSLFRIVDGVNL